MKEEKALTGQQQRVLKLLFKFRFISSGLLADVMGIRKASCYEVLEKLVSRGLATRVYDSSYKIDRKPAYYYLNKTGVTAVRKVMNAKESTVHALYKNDEMSQDFINHSMILAKCYIAIKRDLPEGSAIFTKTEINRYRQFPKNRPDLYIRTSDGREAMIVLVDDKPAYIIRKRLDEIFTHSEDESWEGDNYPIICFILKDDPAKMSFLYTTHKKLESMGIEDGELSVLASALTSIGTPFSRIWSSPFCPKQARNLF